MNNTLNIIQKNSEIQKLISEIKSTQLLGLIILKALRLAFVLAVKIVEAELTERSKEPTDWPNCPNCGKSLNSKGFKDRQITSLLGEIRWKRRVGRCPDRCHIGQIAPLDKELGLSPYQSSSIELCQIACLLAVFVPYETVSIILRRLFPIKVSAFAVWSWVQEYGQLAISNLNRELDDLAQGIRPQVEHMNEAIAQMSLIIGADGVHAPFRPNGGSPSGKTSWQEVKVGILARLGQRIKRNGETVPTLKQRRLVAICGSIDLLKPRLWLEALRQNVLEAKQVVWVSDGGRGFWGLFASFFESFAIGILDFYHAAQNIWKAAAALYDGRTRQARQWFTRARHQLRHGDSDQVLLDISRSLLTNELSDKTHKILENVYEYLYDHRNHTRYSTYKDEMGLPIGSGIVESACKWLIQQRFKGVGMRWSKDGFHNLLHLRLAWVNGRFDELFFPSNV